jgi:hypothetical protein
MKNSIEGILRGKPKTCYLLKTNETYVRIQVEVFWVAPKMEVAKSS